MPSTKGSGKRLSDRERVDIIHKLQRIDPPAKRALGREYNVSENSIRNVWLQRESILARTALMSDIAMKGRFRNTSCHHPQLEDALYLWIDTMRRKKQEVPPSLVLHKAKSIATQMGISNDNFKGTWQWLKKFRLRKGLDDNNNVGEELQADSNQEINKFNGFRSLHVNFIKLKEQIKFEEFHTIDADNKYDEVMSQFEKLEATLRALNRKEQQTIINQTTTQLTIHDAFATTNT